MPMRSESRSPVWALDSCRTPHLPSQSGFGEITLLTRMIPGAAEISPQHIGAFRRRQILTSNSPALSRTRKST